MIQDANPVANAALQLYDGPVLSRNFTTRLPEDQVVFSWTFSAQTTRLNPILQLYTRVVEHPPLQASQTSSWGQ
jgi:hypothetical protein